MSLRSRVLLTIAALLVVLPFIATPTISVEARPAAREITITITEAQFNRYIGIFRTRNTTKVVADIIDGGIIVKIYTRWPDLPEYHEHFGVLIRDGKVLTESGVVDFPGIGGMGYENIKQVVPELIPYLDRDAVVMNRFVLSRIRARAGSRYTPVSVTTGDDKIVIVVSR
jgi:hypothetical protein